MEFISGPYVNTQPLVSDDKAIITSKNCIFTINTPIKTPIINAHVVSTHPAVANTTDNSWKTFFSECIFPEHLDIPSACNNANIEHMKETHQQPIINVDAASTHPAMANTIDNIWKTFFSQCISPEHSDMLSVCNNANMEHVKQTHQQQPTVVYCAEQDQKMLASRPPSQRKQMAISKIPRPPNAFLLFANKWRRTLAMQYPGERNKDISIRLGTMWKSMNKEEKDVYMAIAREVDAEHKRKYPDYVYCPKKARIQKVLRAEGYKKKGLNKRHHKVTAALPSGSVCQQAAQYQQSWTIHYQALQPRDTSRQPHSPHSLLSSRMIAEQQRSLEETKSTIWEQVEQGMIQGSTETYTYIQL